MPAGMWWKSCPPPESPIASQRPWRIGLFALLIGASIPTLAAEPEDEVLYAGDGWPIHVTYYTSAKGQESPVAVLLTAAEGDPDKGVTRRVWSELATHLQKNGIAVVTVDLRKHGDSVPEGGLNTRQRAVRPNDYRAMILGDMEAVKAFLLQKHEAKELNVRKLGIIAGGSSSMVAAAFAVNDWNKKPWPDAPNPEAMTPRGQDVRAIIMISPRVIRGINAAQTLRPLAAPMLGIAFLIYHSDSDSGEKETAERLYKLVELRGEEFQGEEYSGVRAIEARPASGEEFLTGRVARGVQDEITTFLRKYLAELPSPWRSRHSPLQD